MESSTVKPLRLHLGSGRHPWPSNWTDVDIVGNPDTLSDVTDMPMFEDESADEICAIHLFEHIPILKAVSTLEEWCRILKVGGKLILEMPSMDKIAGLIHNGEQDLRLTMLGIFGDARENDPYMLHQWCYTNDYIQSILETCGFSVSFEDPVFHIKKRDFRVIGVKNGR